MELYLSDGWYLINPREIRTVKYFQYLDYANGKKFPPDSSFNDILDNLSSEDEYFWKKESWENDIPHKRIYLELTEQEKEEKKSKIKEKLKKTIQIEMFDKIGNDGHKYPNILNINIGDNNELFNYIYQNLSRKFGLRIRNKEIEKNKVIKLYEHGLPIEEIITILNIKNKMVDKIIEEYKNKKNGI